MVKDVKYVSKLYIFKLTRTLCVSLQRTKLVLLNLLSLLFDICFLLCFVLVFFYLVVVVVIFFLLNYFNALLSRRKLRH